jgi:hypothetical protein
MSKRSRSQFVTLDETSGRTARGGILKYTHYAFAEQDVATIDADRQRNAR